MKISQFTQFVSVFTLSILLSAPAVADEKDVRHGTLDSKLDGKSVDVGATFSAFGTDLDDTNYQVKNELFGSFDMVATLPTASGQWLFYLEANTSPRVKGVSEMLPETNADVGSALDQEGKGRFQVSEFHYSWHGLGGTLISGLIDAAGFIDTSSVANDETARFIATSFVNNPTIALPDYTLGLAYHMDATGNDMGFTALLASSHGLADNEKRSYSALFKIGEGDKGVMLALEAYWLIDNITAKVGVWGSNADDARLVNDDMAAHNTANNTDHDTAHNYGIYAVLDGINSTFNWNVRGGLANDKVSAAEKFLSVSFELPLGENAVGFALAQTWISPALDYDDTLDNIQQAELYYRYKLSFGLGQKQGYILSNNIELTPNLQYIKNSGFNARLDNALIYGVRADWSF